MKKDLISITDLSSDEIETIIQIADLRENIFNEYENALKGKIAATLFFQPSSRTKLSFQSSFLRLGGQYIGFSDIEESRSGSSYNERMCDLGQILDAYCDIAVMRHYDENAIYELAENTSISIISAGNGNVEHPTQALTDLYTIKQEFKQLKNLNILIIGTIPSRSMNSLILACSMWSSISFHVIGNNTCIPEYLKGSNITLYNSVDEVISKSATANEINVIYVTEIKPAKEKNEKYIIHTEDLQWFPNAIVMCPLPRTSELPFSIDLHHAARYFYQARNGIYVRAALYLHAFQII